MQPHVETTPISKIENIKKTFQTWTINELKKKIPSEELHSGKMFQAENFDIYFEVVEHWESGDILLTERWVEEYERLQKLNAFTTTAHDYEIKVCLTEKINKTIQIYNEHHINNKFVLPDEWQEEYTRNYLEVNRPHNAQWKQADIYHNFLELLEKLMESFALFETRKKELNNFLRNISKRKSSIENRIISSKNNNEEARFSFLSEDYEEQIVKQKWFGEVSIQKEHKTITDTKDSISSTIEDKKLDKDLYKSYTWDLADEITKRHLNSLTENVLNSNQKVREIVKVINKECALFVINLKEKKGPVFLRKDNIDEQNDLYSFWRMIQNIQCAAKFEKDYVTITLVVNFVDKNAKSDEIMNNKVLRKSLNAKDNFTIPLS